MLGSTFVSFCVLVLVTKQVDSYGAFRESIPNGFIVPHSCKVNSLWEGVGHQSQTGGGARNPFGVDFKAAGNKWTKELCEKDSDGDGKTNGDELGDPGCTWVKGQAASRTTDLSNPGVCEPWTDVKCQSQNEWVTPECEPDTFDCPAIQAQGVKQQDIIFTPTTVPELETTYMCMEFELDTSDDFHLIATEPILNNTNVMHHAVLFACNSDSHPIRNVPHQCGMVASRECSQIISIWVLGSAGECFHDKVGFRIGNQGYKRVALQFHWNNPTLRTDFVDNSGLRLHYTSNRREFDAGVLTIGGDYINIPPLTASTEQECFCPSECTANFITGNIYVVSAFNHMHYLGKSQNIEVFRNGSKLIELTNDPAYNYDSPVIHAQTNPVEIHPGDGFKTTCTYNSLNRDTITKWGDATNAEMCYGFITYYPKVNVNENFCTSWKSLPDCQRDGDSLLRGCPVRAFSDFTDDDQFQFTKLTELCQVSCTEECNQYLNTLFNHPCMQGDLKDYIEMIWSYRTETMNMTGLIDTCYVPLNPVDTDPNSAQNPFSNTLWYSLMVALYSIVRFFK